MYIFANNKTLLYLEVKETAGKIHYGHMLLLYYNIIA